MKPREKREGLILSLFGILPVIWIALLLAPHTDGSLPELLQKLPLIFAHPFEVELCAKSLRTVLLFLGIYAFLLMLVFAGRRNYRKGEEHGSAKWGDAGQLCRKYRTARFAQDKILTRNVYMGYDSKRHRRNLHTIVVGGSGSGKTRFFAMPNLMQANTSFVVLDPKGENLRTTGYLLEREGYTIRVLDLINMHKSHCYNPFVYLRDDNDVQRLVTNLFRATTPKYAQSQDPFWDSAASMLLLALIFYLKYEAPPEEQNFPMVLELLRAGQITDEEGAYSALDELFDRLETRQRDHIALKYYRNYRSGSGKTLQSIQITLAARLEKFNLRTLSKVVATDELNLTELGEKKVALFAVTPDNDMSYNFLVSILYTQLFQQLFYRADYVYDGTLPVPVHFLLDEFANISLPDDFDKILSVMRSRGVSVSILLQNLAQLKALFEKQWESIVGNCDSFLFLGGNEPSTHKTLSEMLGKSTIDTNTYGKSTGRSGNYSTNYQIGGRELLMSDEVRALDDDYALLFIRGERPVMDKKYEILRHPCVKYTTNGEAEAYRHGTAHLPGAAVQLIGGTENEAGEAVEMAEAVELCDAWIRQYLAAEGEEDADFVMLTEEEVEQMLADARLAAMKERKSKKEE